MLEVLSGRGRVLVSGAGFTSPRVYASSKMCCELVRRLSIVTLLFGALPLIPLEGYCVEFLGVRSREADSLFGFGSLWFLGLGFRVWGFGPWMRFWLWSLRFKGSGFRFGCVS